MDELIKLVRTYRLTAALTEQLRLGEAIYHRVSGELKYGVFSSIGQPAADDVLQDIMQAVITGLSKFNGNSNGEFWAWCHRIARNKINDHLRKKIRDRAEPTPPEELVRLADTQDSSLSAADRLDLEAAMRMLTEAKPECHTLLWKYFVLGLDYDDIAAESEASYDSVRMKVGRCLELAQTLVN